MVELKLCVYWTRTWNIQEHRLKNAVNFAIPNNNTSIKSGVETISPQHNTQLVITKQY